MGAQDKRQRTGASLQGRRAARAAWESPPAEDENPGNDGAAGEPSTMVATLRRRASTPARASRTLSGSKPVSHWRHRQTVVLVSIRRLRWPSIRATTPRASLEHRGHALILIQPRHDHLGPTLSRHARHAEQGRRSTTHKSDPTGSRANLAVSSRTTLVCSRPRLT